MHPILKSLLILAVICPFYIAAIGTCCNKCSDPNPCTPECYSPESPCPDPALVGYLEGTECPFGSTVGQCQNYPAVCIAHECGPGSEFTECDHPRTNPSAGPNSGVCIHNRCVEKSACVMKGVGRINCCSDIGCATARGSRCNPQYFLPDQTPCDPSGVDPGSPIGMSGVCINGYCQAGSCQAPASPTGLGTCQSGVYSSSANPMHCLKDICDPEVSGGACLHEEIDFGFVTCGPTGEICKPGPSCSVGEPCGFECDEDPNDCIEGECRWEKIAKGGTCPDDVCCEFTNKAVGEACHLPGGTPGGMCDSNGTCVAPVCPPPTGP